MSQQSLYTSEAHKEEILEIYQNKLNSLSIPYTTQKVETDFGTTNVVIAGDASKPPLVLIHGANGNGAIALEPFVELIQDHCLYAIDVIGQPNFSSESRPSMKNGSYATWLDSVLRGLDLNEVTVYGMSFGGFILTKALVYQSSRIAKAILHVPAGIVNGNPFIGIFKILIPMKKYIKTQKKDHLLEFLDMAFTERDEFAISFLSKVLLHMKMDFTPVPTLSKKDAKKIKIPVHVIAAAEDCFFPGRKVIKRLEKIVPTLGKVLLLEKSKHVPNQHQNHEICHFVGAIAG